MKFALVYYVTIGTDIMALLILLGMWLVPKNDGEKGKIGARLFSCMGLCIIIGALFDMITDAIPYHLQRGGVGPVMFSHTIVEICTLWFLFLLMLYSDYALFESGDHLRRHYRIYLIPAGILTLMYIINSFTGILFIVDAEEYWIPSKLFYPVQIVQYAIFILPAVYFMIFYLRNDNRGFLHPFSIYVPVLCGMFFSLVSDFSVLFLGFAIGLTFSVFAGMDHWRFMDIKTMFFNRAYLKHITGRIRENEETRGGMILFEAAGSREALVRILKEELPADSEVIVLKKERYLFLSKRDSYPELQLLADMVKYAAQEYDSTNPGKAIRAGISFKVFDKTADTATELSRL